jgi:glycosyltransferase involved in cell wall biosynthesis
MKTLLIDINSVVPFFVSGRVTGIGRTTFELINSLHNVSSALPFGVTLFSQNMKGIGGKNMNSPFKKKHLYLPNREGVNKLIGRFPVKEMLFPYDLMHVPHNFEYVHCPGKTIVTLHDALFMYMNETAFDHLGMRKRVPSLMQRCRGIITCSESSKKDIVETMGIDPDKIDVIYWGIDHEIFSFHKDKDLVKKKLSKQFNIKKPFFLSVSCNAERKNSNLLVEAYLKLLGNNPVNDLVLVWSDPPAFVKKMIDKANIKSRVHFLAGISDPDLAMLYNGATSFIYPSSYEGFGLPILEAMACGTPVVTCSNSSIPEVGGEAVLYMDKPGSENIFKFLEGFENSGFNSSQLSGDGILQASKFTWDKTGLEYLRLYKRYLSIVD